jgi:YVTN family beta-propeller protein
MRRPLTAGLQAKAHVLSRLVNFPAQITSRFARAAVKTSRRSVFAAAVSALSIALVACGYTYRPIVDIVPKPGGDPQASHIALAINSGGTTTQINVSGDTNIAEFAVGNGPVHAMFLFGQNSAFVADRDGDDVAFYSPTQASTQVNHINLPPGSRPIFVASAETSALGNCKSSSPSNVACVYVACSGINSVAVVSAGVGVLQGNPIPVGNNPVALVELPNLTKVYAVNQNDASVSAITTATMQNTATINVGASPVWAVTNSDGSRLYVVNRGSGTITIIDTSTDAVLDELVVGASPVQASYDPKLQRLWVANSGSNTVSVFDVDADADRLLATIPVGTTPVSIVALADGTRVYTANSGSNDVSVIDAVGMKLSKTIALGNGSSAADPVSLAASPDSSKLFVANHGLNSVASISTSNDQVVTAIPTPSSPLFVTVSP